VSYCLVPSEFDPGLHQALRRHFRQDSSVDVIVDRRADERRSGEERRRSPSQAPVVERRRIRGRGGRRVAEQRATLVPVEAPPLPRKLRRQADRLVFVERLEPSELEAEDADTGRLVTRIQAGDREQFALLYMRYFERLYAYLGVVLGNSHEAEEAVQHVFLSALQALPAYERRGTPFRAWLFRIARNRALDELRARGRVEPADPHDVDRRREAETAPPSPELNSLGWLSDRELALFVRRLPQAQRQVLMLRFAADLSHTEIATILDCTPVDVRMLQSRALRTLRDRLTAIGHDCPSRRGKVRMRRWPKEAPVLRARRWALTR
jgi:RNA polymerase sigma-70 factor (ECF subfamily)